MVDGLDVMSVRVEHVGRIVARMIMVPLARPAVVASADRQSRGMERDHVFAGGRLEGQMDASHAAVGAIDPEFVGREEVRALPDVGEPQRG